MLSWLAKDSFFFHWKAVKRVRSLSLRKLVVAHLHVIYRVERISSSWKTTVVQWRSTEQPEWRCSYHIGWNENQSSIPSVFLQTGALLLWAYMRSSLAVLQQFHDRSKVNGPIFKFFRIRDRVSKLNVSVVLTNIYPLLMWKTSFSALSTPLQSRKLFKQSSSPEALRLF